jgi:hypothetical protein
MNLRIIPPNELPEILLSIGLNKERSKFVLVNEAYFLAFQTSTFYSSPYGTKEAIKCLLFDVMSEGETDIVVSFIPLLKVIEQDEEDDEYLEDYGSSSSDEEDEEDELEDDFDNMTLRDRSMFSYEPPPDDFPYDLEGEVEEIMDCYRLGFIYDPNSYNPGYRYLDEKEDKIVCREFFQWVDGRKMTNATFYTKKGRQKIVFASDDDSFLLLEDFIRKHGFLEAFLKNDTRTMDYYEEKPMMTSVLKF